jgi:hypothetical protein
LPRLINYAMPLAPRNGAKPPFEETAQISVGHYSMTRLPTWRIEVGAAARQIKLLPRAAMKERAAKDENPS